MMFNECKAVVGMRGLAGDAVVLEDNPLQGYFICHTSNVTYSGIFRWEARRKETAWKTKT
jgi:hypothetical protein